MSSFRPDTEREAPVFVPLVLGAAHTPERGAGEPALATDFVSESEAPRPSADAGPAPVAPDAPSAEEIEALVQEAFDRGVETARAERTRLESVCDALEAASLKIEAAARTSVSANRDLVLLLVAEIAQHWVGAELRLDAGRYGAVLDRAILACEGANEVRLALHAEDLARLEEADFERFTRWREGGAIEVVSDTNLEQGEFRIDVGSERIDGRPSSIVAGLRDALVEALEADWPEGVA